LDEITRLYIAAGLSAFAILLVMALTSNNWTQRRIGGRKWKKLHRIVYIAIPILIYHRAFAGKVSVETIRETFIWFSPMLILQGLRIWKQIQEQKAKA
jgi:sulfoxide reductase heme-binding subunit YedZ